jgi:hypothetical protein
MGYISGGTGSGEREIIRRYLASHFILKNSVYSACGVPALEVSSLLFVQGFISACGDAL